MVGFRITAENLDELPANLRKQVEGHILDVDERRPVNCAPEKKHKVKGETEEQVGIALTTWMDLLRLPNGLRPGLHWFHIPNGMWTTAAQAGKFKAQGLRKGYPDYGLDIPLGNYHGMRLELKRESGDKPTEHQLEHLARLESMGYKCIVGWGFDDAKRQIEQYLDLIN